MSGVRAISIRLPRGGISSYYVTPLIRPSPRQLALHEVVHDVHGHGEDDGRVVLRRDAVQRLQVAELQTEGREVSHHVIRTLSSPVPHS